MSDVKRATTDLKQVLAAQEPPSPPTPFVPGMTLRDWFAGQIVTTMQSYSNGNILATVCYDLADAMLSEKARREGQP